jgi:hypothetical protein
MPGIRMRTRPPDRNIKAYLFAVEMKYPERSELLNESSQDFCVLTAVEDEKIAASLDVSDTDTDVLRLHAMREADIQETICNAVNRNARCSVLLGLLLRTAQRVIKPHWNAMVSW